MPGCMEKVVRTLVGGGAPQTLRALEPRGLRFRVLKSAAPSGCLLPSAAFYQGAFDR